MGCPGGSCQGQPHGQPKPGHSRFDIDSQAFLAAEQVRATGDIEDQPVGRIHCHQRRVACRSLGQLFEPMVIGRFVKILGNQLGQARPGIGQGHARLKAMAARGLIDRRKPQRALRLDDEGKRRFRR